MVRMKVKSSHKGLRRGGRCGKFYGVLRTYIVLAISGEVKGKYYVI